LRVDPTCRGCLFNGSVRDGGILLAASEDGTVSIWNWIFRAVSALERAPPLRAHPARRPQDAHALLTLGSGLHSGSRLPGRRLPGACPQSGNRRVAATAGRCYWRLGRSTSPAEFERALEAGEATAGYFRLCRKRFRCLRHPPSGNVSVGVRIRGLRIRRNRRTTPPNEGETRVISQLAELRYSAPVRARQRRGPWGRECSGGRFPSSPVQGEYVGNGQLQRWPDHVRHPGHRAGEGKYRAGRSSQRAAGENMEEGRPPGGGRQRDSRRRDHVQGNRRHGRHAMERRALFLRRPKPGRATAATLKMVIRESPTLAAGRRKTPRSLRRKDRNDFPPRR